MTESVGAVTIHTSDTVNQVLYIFIWTDKLPYSSSESC